MTDFIDYTKEGFFEFFKILVQKLIQIKENKHCADCLSKESSWLSLNFGVFICLHCSSVHRSLGPNYSKLKNTTTEKFNKQEYEIIKGNVEVNSMYECNLLTFEKPLSSDPSFYRKFFIKEKYNKKFMASSSQKKFERGNLTLKEGKSWSKRWFVLNEDSLSLYKAKSDTFISGTIPMDEKSTVMFVDERQEGKKNCFAVVTQGKMNLMYSDTEEECTKWVYHLRATVYYLCLRQIVQDPKNFLMEEKQNDIYKSGFLVKKGAQFHSMKKRWFILKKGMLSYYNDNKSPEPIQSIPMKGVVVEKTDKLSLKVSSKERQFFFTGENEKDIDEWKKLLDESAQNESFSGTIQKKSLLIHSLILNKLIRSSSDENVSFHSPLMWRTFSFHRISIINSQQNQNVTVVSSNNKTISDIARRTSVLQIKQKKEDEEVVVIKEVPQFVKRDRTSVLKDQKRPVRKAKSMFQKLHGELAEQLLA